MKTILSAATAAILAITAPSTALGAVAAPHVKAHNFEQLAKPLPLPYHDVASASAAVDKARARARASGKLLLIDLGGNWCLDCRILAGTIDLPDLKPWFDRHYEIVTVDIGRFDKNLDVPARYGFTKRLEGVPALLIVDPKSDKLLNADKTTALADARTMSPQGLADYLARYAR